MEKETWYGLSPEKFVVSAPRFFLVFAIISVFQLPISVYFFSIRHMMPIFLLVIGVISLGFYALFSVLAKKSIPEIRLREGRCSNCGYDLKHTPHQCPECGSVPTES